MQRIDSDNKLFTDGNPATGTVGTRVKADWLNAVQEELANVIENAVLTLDPGDSGQVWKVLRRRFDAWMEEPNTVARFSDSSFSVAGDRTDVYTENRAISLTQTASAKGYVTSSSYSAGTPGSTTVSVTGCTVDSGLSAVDFGQEPQNAPKTNIPTGMIAPFPVANPPAGWLECDGSAVSKTTYASLYTFLKDGGTTAIYGEATTTFNLPDYRGEFLRGWDHGANRDPDMASRTDRGDTINGDHVGTKQNDALEAHVHTEHETYQGGSAWYVGTGGAVLANQSVNTGSTGGNETRPRNVNVLWCIKY